MITLQPVKLTAEAFAPFGDVIQAPAFDPSERPNRRFDDLARLDAGNGGRLMISMLSVRAPVRLPFDLAKMERHPLGSQAFIPCRHGPLLVVVAPPGERPEIGMLKAFITDGRQGVNYLKGVWHAPIAALAETDFLVVDRHGPEANCDLYPLDNTPVRIVESP